MVGPSRQHPSAASPAGNPWHRTTWQASPSPARVLQEEMAQKPKLRGAGSLIPTDPKGLACLSWETPPRGRAHAHARSQDLGLTHVCTHTGPQTPALCPPPHLWTRKPGRGIRGQLSQPQGSRPHRPTACTPVPSRSHHGLSAAPGPHPQSQVHGRRTLCAHWGRGPALRVPTPSPHCSPGKLRQKKSRAHRLHPNCEEGPSRAGRGPRTKDPNLGRLGREEEDGTFPRVLCRGLASRSQRRWLGPAPSDQGPSPSGPALATQPR